MTTLTGNQIDKFRFLTLRRGLMLEISGMKVSRGTSCYAILKKDFGLKGSRQEVLEQTNEIRKLILGERND